MIMEFCEKGSLERAINHGTFVRRSDRQPEMVSGARNTVTVWQYKDDIMDSGSTTSRVS
jgi:hypothetical protein